MNWKNFFIPVVLQDHSLVRNRRLLGLIISLTIHGVLIFLLGRTIIVGESSGQASLNIDGDSNNFSAERTILVHLLPKPQQNADKYPTRNAFASSSGLPSIEIVQRTAARMQPMAVLSKAEAAAAHQGGGESEAVAAQEPVGGAKMQGELLRQIARCLPKDVRPALPLARLELRLDSDGKPLAAPNLIRYPFMSDHDTALADRVVQAALQCAPYKMVQVGGASLSVEVDFSSVDQKTGDVE